MVANIRKREREEKQRIGREARSDQEVILKLLTFMHNSNRVHFPDSAEKRPSRLHTRLMHFNEVKCQVIYNRTLTNSHLPHNHRHGFRKIKYPTGVSQLSPSQVLTVKEGYTFSQEDPISLGIPVYKTFRQW